MSISGTYDLNKLPPIYDDMLSIAFGSTDPEVLASASPATYVSPGMNQSALFYAEDDMPGVTGQALGYGKRLQKNGNSVHLEMLPEVTHVTEIAEVTPDNPYHVTALAIYSYVNGASGRNTPYAR